ncbi:MAG: hypothetical protein WC043_10800 [Pseudobdellovibrionaceae bacterium]
MPTLKKYIFLSVSLLFSFSAALLLLCIFPAQAYDIRLQFAHNPEKIYAHTCADDEATCAAYFSIPFMCDTPSPDKKFCRGTIEAGVMVEDGTMSIGFLYGEAKLSTSPVGWQQFDQPLRFLNEIPQPVDLYIPNPMNDEGSGLKKSLVLLPPNAFLTSVIVSVK